MPSRSGHVYCYQFGSDDCFKVGRTKHQPEKRKRGFATGSPVKFTLYRDEAAENASELESYTHQLLAAQRASNGEFVNVTQEELDDAVDKAVAFMKEYQPVRSEANGLRRKKPKETIAEPSVEIREIHRQLMEARREQSLLDWRIGLLESRVQVAIGENCGMRGIASWNWVDHWVMKTEMFTEEDKKSYGDRKSV